MDDSLTKRHSSIFWGFCVFHLLLWTTLPALVRHHLPMDSLEALTWGRHLDFGYDRNPYLNAWIGGLLNHLAAGKDWPVYLCSALLVLSCFYGLWRLASYWLNPAQALVATFMMEGLQFFNISAVELNDNTLLLGLWPLCTLCFYMALRNHKLSTWSSFGLLAGFAMMSKYNSIFLLLSLLFYTLQYELYHFKKAGPYLAITIISALCLPNWIWLTKHQFVTIHYTLHSLRPNETLLTSNAHWQEPLHFAYILLLSFLGPLFLLSLSVSQRTASMEQNTHHRPFLLWISLGPFVMTLLAGAITGCSLRINWGQPLLSFWGITLLAYWQPNINHISLKRFLMATMSILILISIGYSYALLTAQNESTANYPGFDLATQVTHYWQRYVSSQTPAFIVGDRFIAGSIAHYSPLCRNKTHDCMEVFLDANPKRNPTISINQLQAKGGLVVWQATENNTTPPTELRMLVGNMIHITAIRTDYHHSNTPLLLGVGMIDTQTKTAIH